MKTNFRLAVIALVLSLTLALGVTPVRAQDSQGAANAANMEILREKIHADKKLVVAANMDLTDAEAKAFWPIYDEYQTKLNKINQHLLNLVKEYAQNYQNMSNDMAKKLLKESMAVEKERLVLKETIMPKLLKVLSPVKAARYYQIENKIQAALQYELAGGIPLMK